MITQTVQACFGDVLRRLPDSTLTQMGATASDIASIRAESAENQAELGWNIVSQKWLENFNSYKVPFSGLFTLDVSDDAQMASAPDVFPDVTVDIEDLGTGEALKDPTNLATLNNGASRAVKVGMHLFVDGTQISLQAFRDGHRVVTKVGGCVERCYRKAAAYLLSQLTAVQSDTKGNTVAVPETINLPALEQFTGGWCNKNLTAALGDEAGDPQALVLASNYYAALLPSSTDDITPDMIAIPTVTKMSLLSNVTEGCVGLLANSKAAAAAFRPVMIPATPGLQVIRVLTDQAGFPFTVTMSYDEDTMMVRVRCYTLAGIARTCPGAMKILKPQA